MLRALLGIGQPAKLSAQAVAAGNAAAANTQLTTEEATNAELQAAAAARAAADAERVRNDPHSDDVTTDPKAGVNLSPDAHFRD